MASATLENIFYCHGRSPWVYAKPNEILNILPVQIGYSQIEFCKTLKENLKQRHYIKIGEKCIICFDPIYKKNDALLTDCGHYFHNSCVQKYYEMNFKQVGNCPLCRQDIGEGSTNQIYCNSKKILDKLEDFWMHSATLIPKKCYELKIDVEGIRSMNYIHDLGMNAQCVKCLDYRQGKYKLYFMDQAWQFE